jgi:hypothetical protein
VNVEITFSTRKLGDFFLQLLDLGALFTNNDTWTGGVDVNLRFVSRPFDFNLRDAGVIKPAL